ncbi:hypothetical protein B5X24_HaOG207672 [Helicoverpa armigera]|uniref:Uncharacterized protein n=1 Tax=Helicoverpa armigera TaxID=29058 RepID=A0A2W1BP92_HELAM|nr:hypothetical protein B5X24_HaOG207672 [Helicoverpa armigera]
MSFITTLAQCSVDVTPTKDTNTKEKGGGEKEQATVPQTEDLSLSLNIEELLGAEGLPSTSTAIELHESLAKRWSAILQNGLNADTKNNIIRKYDTPKNCNLLIPPKLNEEVAAALSESAIKRDQRIRNQQTILAAAITTIGKTLNNLIASPQNESETLPQIETLSDAARLLCDIYHDNTVTRRSLILPGLNKDMKELMEQTPISEYLFGDKLQDKVNAIKAVKKSGQELKNTPARVPLKPKNLNFRGPQRHQLPRPSGQKQKLKRNAQVTKPSKRTRRSPQRQQHHQRPGARIVVSADPVLRANA